MTLDQTTPLATAQIQFNYFSINQNRTPFIKLKLKFEIKSNKQYFYYFKIGMGHTVWHTVWTIFYGS